MALTPLLEVTRISTVFLQTYRHTDIQTYRHTDIQTYKHTNIQTFRHTDRHRSSSLSSYQS